MKLPEYGELVPVVSVERQSVSKPVPEKVMADMRLCGAAIIHVDADKTITDTGGDEHVLLNPRDWRRDGILRATLYPASARRRETSI